MGDFLQLQGIDSLVSLLEGVFKFRDFFLQIVSLSLMLFIQVLYSGLVLLIRWEKPINLVLMVLQLDLDFVKLNLQIWFSLEQGNRLKILCLKL
jgi:hypothetical protein